MRSMGAGYVVLCMLVGAAGAARAADESAEIAALSDRWEAALVAGDVEGLAALYAEDARLMAPNEGLAVGRDAVRAVFGGMIAAGLGGELTTLEAVASGDLGHNVGTYTVTTSDGSVVDRGKFIETWERVDGEWRITNDIYNSDLPAGPQGATVVLTHEVDDVAHWLAAWTGEGSRHELFAAHGVPAVEALTAAEGNRVALVATIADREAFEAMLASEEGQAAAAEDGVRLETLTTYEQ